MRNLVRLEKIRKMSVLLLSAAMCLCLCTDFSVSAQEDDLGVMTKKAEQEEPLIGRQRENMKSLASELHAPRIKTDSSMEAGQKVTWDCVWFGSYPQSEVISSDPIYSTLQNVDGWDSNNDITISGNRYRRMKKEDATYAAPPIDTQWGF